MSIEHEQRMTKPRITHCQLWWSTGCWNWTDTESYLVNWILFSCRQSPCDYESAYESVAEQP